MVSKEPKKESLVGSLEDLPNFLRRSKRPSLKRACNNKDKHLMPSCEICSDVDCLGDHKDASLDQSWRRGRSGCDGKNKKRQVKKHKNKLTDHRGKNKKHQVKNKLADHSAKNKKCQVKKCKNKRADHRGDVTKSNLRVECKICGKQFKYFYMKEHMFAHQDVKRYLCKVCGKTFKWHSTYRNHTRSHDPELKTDYDKTMCSMCGKSFSLRAYLKIHERRFCSTITKEPVVVQKQKPKRKLGECETRFQCSVCSKEFVTKSILFVHMKCHTNIDSMTCHICSQTFFHQGNLRRHLLSHGMDNRPYQCSHCKARFTQNSSLKAHERRHTGDKPYLCQNCGRGFTQSSNRKAHEKRCKLKGQSDENTGTIAAVSGITCIV